MHPIPRPVVGHRQHVRDTHVPVRVIDRKPAETQEGGLPDGFELAHIIDRAMKRDLRSRLAGFSQLDRYKSRPDHLLVARLND